MSRDYPDEGVNLPQIKTRYGELKQRLEVLVELLEDYRHNAKDLTEQQKGRLTGASVHLRATLALFREVRRPIAVPKERANYAWDI